MTIVIFRLLAKNLKWTLRAEELSENVLSLHTKQGTTHSYLHLLVIFTLLTIIKHNREQEGHCELDGLHTPGPLLPLPRRQGLR